MNELIRHFGDLTIIVNARKLANENPKQAKLHCLFLFLKRLVQAFQYLGFTADLWTEHCLTELCSDPTLVDFQQSLELQAQIYDKLSQESNQRTISSQASKFVNSNNLQTKQYNSNLPVAIKNASAENSRKHCNFAPRQKQMSTSQNDPNKTFNTKRSCEKCKQNTALPHALSISCAHQVIDTTLSAKTVCVQTV